jgi:hypothetical protein
MLSSPTSKPTPASSPPRSSGLLHRTQEEDLLPHINSTARLVRDSLQEHTQKDTAEALVDAVTELDKPDDLTLLFQQLFPVSSIQSDCGHLRRDPRLQSVRFTV